jgi:hypothetical protein
VRPAINRRDFIKAFGLGAATLAVKGCISDRKLAAGKPDVDKPNFIVIFTDDQGYADVGCFGAKGFETPNLDQMAAEGAKFTSFYSRAFTRPPLSARRHGRHC